MTSKRREAGMEGGREEGKGENNQSVQSNWMDPTILALIDFNQGEKATDV